MIVVTGAAGFIGSSLIRKLNDENFSNIIAVDLFNDEEKLANLKDKKLSASIDRNVFLDWLDKRCEEVEFIFHLGARTDTTETDRDLLWKLNTDYSKAIWTRCRNYQIPLIYASSAATYGRGENGYCDDESTIEKLVPLNPYAESKHAFDLWALKQEKKPFYWAGLKFFNVYGTNESHKGKMASVVFHAFHQIRETGEMKLFRSHNSDFQDGEQMRDFIYVKDVVDVMYWLMHHRKNSGIFNVGTGNARTFNDLAAAVFDTHGKEKQITYIDTPEEIREHYQYFTEADMQKLNTIGYSRKFTTLEDGVKDCIPHHFDLIV